MAAVTCWQARPLENLREILDSRRSLLHGEQVDALDCLCVAPFRNHDELWISTPNMDFVPEVPVHPDDTPFRYFGDGMLGAFEHLKWPQAFDPVEPHSYAAPMNPRLKELQKVDDHHGLRAPDFPVDDKEGGLPQFEDPDAAWFSFKGTDFRICEELPRASVGILYETVLSRLRKAMLEVRRIGDEIGAQEFPEGTPAAVVNAHTSSYMYQRHRSEALYRAYGSLSQIPMPFSDTVLWFREFQRILLELRAWIIYMLVVKPRMEDPTFDCPQPVLPLRGVITSSLSMLRELFRIGIPVWYIRRRTTLTTRTLIISVKTVIRTGISFSSSQIFEYANHRTKAPLWVEASHGEPLRGTIQDRLRKFSLTSRPILLPLEIYSPATVGEIERQNPPVCRNHAMSGPDISHVIVDEIPTERDVNSDERQTAMISAFTGNVYAAKLVRDGPRFIDDPACTMFETTTSDFVVLASAYSSNDQWRRSLLSRSRSSDKREHRPPSPDVKNAPKVPDVQSNASHSQISSPPKTLAPHKQRSNSHRCHGPSPKTGLRVVHPTWLPPLAPGWISVFEETMDLDDDPNMALQYPLPPIHLFFADKGAVFGHRVHNWLRIRMWCLLEVLCPSNHCMVLMTTSQWRIALEGRYYLPDNMVNCTVKPQSSSHDMARLPPWPRKTKKARLEPQVASNVTSASSVEVRKRKKALDRRVADRVDIGVRFLVHAGFAPYDDTTSPQWGRTFVTSKMAHEDKDLWAEVVWELSVANFRLELLQLDRKVVMGVYCYEDKRYAAQREGKICHIWATGGLSVDWERESRWVDRLVIEDWEARRGAVKVMAEVLCGWPGGSKLMWHKDYDSNFKAFTDFEHAVFLFYTVTFHKHCGRLPIMPLSQPKSLARHVHS